MADTAAFHGRVMQPILCPGAHSAIGRGRMVSGWQELCPELWGGGEWVAGQVEASPSSPLHGRQAGVQQAAFRLRWPPVASSL